MLGNRLKELRKLKGITQKELAEHLDLKSQTTIAAIENMKNKPSNKLLEKIADYFNVSTDFLLGKTEIDAGYLKLSFAYNIKNKRLAEKLTHAELAKKLNINEVDLISIENACFPDAPIINFYTNVCEYINFPIEKFLEYVIHETYGEAINNKDKLNEALEYLQKILERELSDDYNSDPENDSNNNLISNLNHSVNDPKKSANKNLFSTIDDIHPIMQTDMVNIPIIGVIRAGHPTFAAENIEGYYPTHKDVLSSDKEYFYLRVKGDSMNLKFDEGSLLLVEKTSYIENGQIGVVLINGFEATVKKIVKNENVITLIPMSTNTVHLPQMYDIIKDEVKIIGRAKIALNFL